jgi:hypothetical protein
VSGKRQCGACSLCCVLIRIEAPRLHKRAGDPCPLLTSTPDGCCSIYQLRPRCCRLFSCAWSDEVIDEQFAPIETGIVGQMYAGEALLGMRLWVDESRYDPVVIEDLLASLPDIYTEVTIHYGARTEHRAHLRSR